MRYWYLLCSLSILCPCARAQGPIGGFPTPKGEVVVAPAYSIERYDTYLLPGDMTEVRDIETVSYSLFLETGLSEQTALVATLPWMEVNGSDGSLQDASVWLKYTNVDQPGKRAANRLFTAVGLRFPVGNYATEGIAALGQRATVFQGRLAYQYQHNQGWFLHLQSGIDFQFAPDSRATWPLLLRTGFGSKYFYTEGWLEIVTALENEGEVQTATAGAGSSWRRLGGSIYVPVRPWMGLNAGAAWVLGGTFIGQSARYNVGPVFRF